MCNVKIRVLGGVFNKNSSQQLNQKIQVGKSYEGTVTELIFRGYRIDCEQTESWVKEDDYYSTVIETKGTFLKELGDLFFKDEIFKNVSVMEIFVDGSEKLGYKRLSKSGKISWFVEKDRPELLDRLRNDVVISETENEITNVSTVGKVLDPFFPDHLYPFKDYQFYKWDEYKSSVLLSRIEEMVDFSSVTV